MKSLLCVVAFAAVFAQQPYDPCATGETPCNPDQPWMRGTVEKYCGHTSEVVTRMKEDRPLQADRISVCECQHTCDPLNESGHAPMTEGLAWDGKCAARCSPKNCACPDPCQSE